MKINGRTALVTGATGGIGRAVSQALADRGAQVTVTGRRADEVDALAEQVRGLALRADLTVQEDLERVLARAAEVDIVVANAGLPASGTLDSFSTSELDRALDVNLRAPLHMVRACAGEMVRRGRGHIVFVSSLAGKAAPPRCAVYCATKFGLRGLGLSLREDLHDSGVGVSVVFPGYVSGAGMFADAHVDSLPPGAAVVTTEQVADGVVRAIRRDLAEVAVAPLGLRVGSAFFGLAPSVSASVNRRWGGLEFAEAVAAGQRDKR